MGPVLRACTPSRQRQAQRRGKGYLCHGPSRCTARGPVRRPPQPKVWCGGRSAASRCDLSFGPECYAYEIAWARHWSDRSPPRAYQLSWERCPRHHRVRAANGSSRAHVHVGLWTLRCQMTLASQDTSIARTRSFRAGCGSSTRARFPIASAGVTFPPPTTAAR